MFYRLVMGIWCQAQMHLCCSLNPAVRASGHWAGESEMAGRGDDHMVLLCAFRYMR